MSGTVPSPDGGRFTPLMPAHNYLSYQLVAPLKTHWRQASCEETRCANFIHGWRVRKELLDAQMLHVATHSGRKFHELHVADGETYLMFEAGQPCFEATEHRVRLDREELYFRRPGDWRGNPTGERPYQHTKPQFWVEDFSEHQSKIISAIEQG